MSPIINVERLTFPWQTRDPFLFCVHHNDHYPPGNDEMGPPREELAGRRIGMDFAGRDGWSMYHGDVVPGFPAHPHRGFETITIARRGYIDHADSLGATARFGKGDVQWMTAGNGVVHSEMFPLVHREEHNPTELFQIWLNLARVDKKKDAHFTMLWNESIPRQTVEDGEGRETELRVVAGSYGELVAPPPPPASWASRAESHVAVWTLKLAPGARFTIPAGPEGTNRTLYFFVGDTLEVGHDAEGRAVEVGHAIDVRPDVDVVLTNGGTDGEVLMLQGRPIGEPVVQHGPFVANSVGEIRQAMVDFQMKKFGQWPWPSPSPVHPRGKGRFAVHADGRVEEV